MTVDRSLTESATRDLDDRYSAAWATYDVDAIVAMHAPYGAAQTHMSGEVEHVGHDAIRTHWETTFAVWPDVTFETRRLHVFPGLVVHEMTIRATLGVPLPGEDGEIPADGRGIEVAAVDVMPWADGLLVRKDTYLDSGAMLTQLTAGHSNA
jgi:ketosteroid isomerase-like protein